MEKEKMKTMVREKKKKYWKRFCKENSEKDLWEVVKWAKDLWRIREVMKSLKDIDDNLLNTDEEKEEGLVRNHFGSNEGGRKLDKEEERMVDKGVDRNALEEMVIKVKTALSRTQNSSAAEPDGISYRFIKTIKDSILREKLIEEVAKNQSKGIIPSEWQNSKVVMIHKPGKDHKKTKG